MFLADHRNPNIPSKVLGLNAAEVLVDDGIDGTFLLHALKKGKGIWEALPLTYVSYIVYEAFY